MKYLLSLYSGSIECIDVLSVVLSWPHRDARSALFLDPQLGQDHDMGQANLSRLASSNLLYVFYYVSRGDL